jgi:hypothetical protein
MKQKRIVILAAGGSNVVYWTGCYKYRKDSKESSPYHQEMGLDGRE